MAVSRPIFYREVLTPTFHRRFTNSALLVLAFCYIEAIFIAEKTSRNRRCTEHSLMLGLLVFSVMDLVSHRYCRSQDIAPFRHSPFDIRASGCFDASR